MTRSVCLALNALLGGVILAYALWNPVVGPAGHREELAFYFMVAGLFFAVAAGLAVRRRWMIVIAAIPLVLGSLFSVLIVGAGGWQWGPSTAGAIRSAMGCAVAIGLLETVCIIVARGIRAGGQS